MEILLKDLLGKRESLKKVLGAELPVMASYKLSKVIDALDKEFNYFETARNDLIKKLGKENKEGNISIEPGSKEFEEFDKELSKILDEKVKVEVKQFPMELLGDKVELSAFDMKNLVGFILEDLESKPAKKEDKKEE